MNNHNNQYAKAVKITDNIYWVGAIDWSVRDFHGYSTGKGTTYNAFLVLDDKITLIDTVKAPFKEEFLSRIRSVVDLNKIDYIVSNHSELDHSGCLPDLLTLIKPEKIFASAAGVKALKDHFHWSTEVTTAHSGDGIKLGHKHLYFKETKMLHWPDSMFSYIPEEQFLFSQDAFGMHLATAELFEDENRRDTVEWEAAKYFANILMPFSNMILKVIEEVNQSGWNLRYIAPDHGPIWRRDPSWIINAYEKWARQEPAGKAVLIYDTMWGSTKIMATAIVDAMREEGIKVKAMNLSASHRSDVATELLRAGALIVGSPTLNNHLFPTIADVLTYLKGLRPNNLIGACFGSYGWGGEAIGQLTDFLQGMKVEIVADPVKAKYHPTIEDLQHCRDLGKKVALALKEKIVV